MAYEPKTWTCGEVVTADALNHMEQGIADAGGVEVFVVNFDARGTSSSSYTVTADKTFAEVVEAHNRGAVIVFHTKEQFGSNPYAVYSALATARTTFNEQSELIFDEFDAIAIPNPYSNSKAETILHSNDVANFSFYE